MRVPALEQAESLPGPGHSDIEDPSLLFHLRRVLPGQPAAIGHEHVIKLHAFGAVHGAEKDSVPNGLFALLFRQRLVKVFDGLGSR